MPATSTCVVPPLHSNWAHPGPAGTTTISNAAQATEVAKCNVLQGSLEIDASFAGPLNLDGIKLITGGLIADNVNDLTSISAADLQAVGNELHLSGLPALTSLELPKLESASVIGWIELGKEMQYPEASALKYVDVFFIQKTGIRDLDWLSLKSVTRLHVHENDNMEKMSLPLLTAGYVDIIGNAQRSAAVDLPNLATGSVSCVGCSSMSLPLLAACSNEGSVQVADSLMESLSLPSLRDCSFLNILSNPNLKDIFAPLLEEVVVPNRMAPWIVGISVGNNPLLEQTIAFPALRTVTGASFNGTFSTVSLPALSDETRLLHFNSTKDISATCEYFQSIAGPDNIVRGEVTCMGGSTDSHTPACGGSPYALLGGAMALKLLLVALLFGVFMFRRARRAAMSTGVDQASEPLIEVTEEVYDEKSGEF